MNAEVKAKKNKRMNEKVKKSLAFLNEFNIKMVENNPIKSMKLLEKHLEYLTKVVGRM